MRRIELTPYDDPRFAGIVGVASGPGWTPPARSIATPPAPVRAVHILYLCHWCGWPILLDRHNQPVHVDGGYPCRGMGTLRYAEFSPPLTPDAQPWEYPRRPDTWQLHAPLPPHMAACLCCIWCYDERCGGTGRLAEEATHRRASSHPTTHSPWPPLPPVGVHRQEVTS